MKDDIDLPIETEIKSCIEVEYRDGKWKEVGKLLNYFWEREEAFLRTLDSKTKRDFFQKNFIFPKAKTFSILRETLEKLRVYGSYAEYDISDLDRLISKIDSFCFKFSGES
jgi:hypothetical protein